MNKVILKISGEALKYNGNLVDESKLKSILNLINKLKEKDYKIAIVVGGGNIFRGREHLEMDKVLGDSIGMMGTVINALYIKDYLIKNNINTIISTPFVFPKLMESYEDIELKELYENGSVIVFGGGVGESGYSTDSGLLYACEKLDANLFVKITNVDGVYDSDPKTNKDAKIYKNLFYDEVINNNLEVMDMEAITYAKDNNIKILVINFDKCNQLNDLINDECIGTIISD